MFYDIFSKRTSKAQKRLGEENPMTISEKSHIRWGARQRNPQEGHYQQTNSGAFPRTQGHQFLLERTHWVPRTPDQCELGQDVPVHAESQNWRTEARVPQWGPGQPERQTNKNQIKTKKQRHWGQISRTFKTMCGRSNPPRFHSEGGHPMGPGIGKVLENDNTGSCQQDTHFQKSPKEITSCLEFYMLSNH